MKGRPGPYPSERQSAQLKQAINKCISIVALAGTIAVSSTLAQAAIHVVRPGETLSHIAKLYGKSVQELVELNDIRSADLIRVGDEITIADEPTIYVVQPGDTLSQIARKFNLSADHLAHINGISNPDRISVGQEIIVAHTIQHRVARGETVSAIAKAYGVTTQSLIALNGLTQPDRIRVGQTLLIPPMGGGVVEATAGARSTRTIQSFDRWPVQGVISSNFGMRGGRPHEGLDIAAPHGTEIRAVAAGTVVYADSAGTYGLLVRIDHGNGIETRYAHASRLLVKPGDYVTANQVIARVGSTGRSTGPHLHFEVRVGGEAVDPIKWLP